MTTCHMAWYARELSINRSAGARVYTVHIMSLESESQQYVVSFDTVFISDRLIRSFFSPTSGCVDLSRASLPMPNPV
jgi:hypothetical protein